MCTIKLQSAQKPVNQVSAEDEFSIKVATHNGMYHADDVVAISILAENIPAENIELIRTRDQTAIDAADIAVDVGGEYCPVTYRYDHHFVGSPTREDGTQLASAGMVAKSIPWLRPQAFKYLDAFVRRVDASDTGVKTPGWRFSVSLSKTNPLPGAPSHEYDERFLEVVEVVRRSVIPILVNWVHGEDAVEDVIEAATSAFEKHPRISRWILENQLAQNASAARITAAFNRAVAAGDYLVRLDQPEVALYETLGLAPAGLYYVTFPSEGNHKVQQIPVEVGSFSGRLPLPEAWAGKKSHELQALTGVHDAVFCHPGRFIAAAETAAGAVRLAELAMSAKP
jgi:uncharacterized UPF0160 family protein